MNSPADPHPPSAGLSERVTRLEVTCERILDELRELRTDMREMRSEMRNESREMRNESRELRRTATADFRILFGAIIAVALGLAGVMAGGFGWI
jgi:hypothetical protein